MVSFQRPVQPSARLLVAAPLLRAAAQTLHLDQRIEMRLRLSHVLPDLVRVVCFQVTEIHQVQQALETMDDRGSQGHAMYAFASKVVSGQIRLFVGFTMPLLRLPTFSILQWIRTHASTAVTN
jgi:hypothetical protein